jgi:predicted transcriptional regulator|nr:MAG TPA: Protein of unknown function (DUF1804) [Caudoviricetes sp.]
MTQHGLKQKPDYVALKREAKELFFEGKNQKDIASLLKVSAVTVSNWCKDGGWKSEREARLDSAHSRLGNIQEVIDCLVRQRLSLITEISDAEISGDKELLLELRRKQKGISDEISKLRKEKEDVRSEGKKQLTLSNYLSVMDSVFRHMQAVDPELYHCTLDFQELHLAKITKEIG